MTVEKNWPLRLIADELLTSGEHPHQACELLCGPLMSIWKKKQTIAQQTKSSKQEDERSQVRNDDAAVEARRYSLDDGDLSWGDEGVDDPPEQV